MKITITDLLFPLNQLSSCLGEVAPIWSECEELEWLEWEKSILDRNKAIAISLNVYQNLWTVFQDSITIKISIGDLPVFQLSSKTTDQDLISLKTDTIGSTYVRFSLQIDKSRLIEILYNKILDLIPEPKQTYIYLYSSRCSKFLSGCQLIGLEEILWRKNGLNRVVFFLPDEEIFLAGPRLLMLGGGQINMDNISTALHETTSADSKQSESAYNRCRTNLIWQEAFVHILTPWHLYVVDKIDKHSLIRNTLFGYFVDIFLLFTADGTFLQEDRSDKPLIARYNSPDNSVGIPLESSISVSTLVPAQMKGLKEILDWIYDPQWESINDRLSLTQLNIVDALNPIPLEERLEKLVVRATELHTNNLWHWKSFTENKLKSYVGIVKDLEKYLSDVLQEFASDITEIQKTLSETLLAGLAVLIGSFLAALFSNPFNPLIFRIGMFSYAVYILIIPLIYNMLLHWWRYKMLKEQIYARKEIFSSILPAEQVNNTWELWKIESTRNRFKIAFWVTASLYAVAIVLLIIAAINIPNATTTITTIFSQPTISPTSINSLTITPYP